MCALEEEKKARNLSSISQYFHRNCTKAAIEKDFSLDLDDSILFHPEARLLSGKKIKKLLRFLNLPETSRKVTKHRYRNPDIP